MINDKDEKSAVLLALGRIEGRLGGLIVQQERNEERFRNLEGRLDGLHSDINQLKLSRAKVIGVGAAIGAIVAAIPTLLALLQIGIFTQ